MPTGFLTRHQRSQFATFPASLSQDDLTKAFTLDDADMRAIASLRTSRNRLGFAVLLMSIRFIGVFPASADEIPQTVTDYLSAQLHITGPISLVGYFASKTCERHVRLIRETHGFIHFSQAPFARFRLIKWLYGECWLSDERPGVLVLRAADWLIAHKIILPGISILERLVGRVRDRAQTRLWTRLVQGLTDTQRIQIEALFQEEGDMFSRLDILRASPLKRKQADFWKHLNRLDAVRIFDLTLSPPRGVPAIHLERLARVAKRAKPSALAQLKEPRRTATVAALFYTLEASAQDDALELANALIADMFREAEHAHAKAQTVRRRELNTAILLLKDLAGRVIRDDEELSYGAWRDVLYTDIAKEQIQTAIALVDDLIKPSSHKPYTELQTKWRRARRLFSAIVNRIDTAASPGGLEVERAMTWLKGQKDWSKLALADAPKDVISTAWKPHVLNAKGDVVDAKAYIFATIDAWRDALKRRDVFASPGIRYADPRLGMLEGQAWQNNKSLVCRSLNKSANPHKELTHLSKALDDVFQRVATRSQDNPDLNFKSKRGKQSLSVAKLDRMKEPDSLIQLRRRLHDLLPKATIADILLETMQQTQFQKAFTHVSERPSKAHQFEISLCAALMAEGCNIGFEPVARNTHDALHRNRLSWINQNFIRPETLTLASAKIAVAHAKLPIAQHWGSGQTVSADGLRFLVPKSAIHAGPNARYFGQGRGITWYNMISDQYAGIGATVVPGTMRDSLIILALLLGQETELDPKQVMTDTAAYSDTVFGLFWLLGYQFCPRLADIGSARLWRIEKDADYGPFNDSAKGRINVQLIIDNWDDLLRLAGSLKLGYLQATDVMRILQVKERPTSLAKALVQLGRIIKTMHILNYVDDASFRRRILTQLNRQEFRHKLARKIYHGDRGEVRNSLKQGQEEQLAALGLILNAVIYWNAIYMQEAITALENDGLTIAPADIARLSPILWRHINFLGRYDISLPESVAQGKLRPLRDPTSARDF